MDIEQKQFEERSDYLDEEQVLEWFVSSSYFDEIQKKLTGTGAKLLVGPRGTGKTHQMRLTYYRCLTSIQKPVALYVSFNKYYHLEPLLSRAANAIKIFNTWVLSKIILSIYDFCEKTNNDPSKTLTEKWLSKDNLEIFIGQAEKGNFRFENEDLLEKINVYYVQNIIDNLISISGRKRAILLLDDAAITLTPEYLIDFFEIFVSIKSSRISPKASVYPGTTEYGFKFNLGHDAEKVECWINVSEDMSSYSAFMNDLIVKRFSSLINNIDSSIVDLFKYASFGIPRRFIFLLRSFQQSQKITKQAKFNEVIDQHADLIITDYRSLQKKMPQFADIIDVGYIFFNRIVDQLTESNKKTTEKNLIIGIEKDDNKMINRMLQLLNEAALLYKYSSNVNHGDGREYMRFCPNILFLIKSKAFSSSSRGFDSKAMLQKLLLDEKKQPLRRKFETLLDKKDFERLTLNLPPCANCNAVRLQEDQRFCHKCGYELVTPSAFENCMEMDVSIVPLTAFQHNAVKKANFHKIRDFYTVQNPSSELRRIERIGGKTSIKIITKVRKVVDEFLA